MVPYRDLSLQGNARRVEQEELLNLNREGLIPGPGESERAFLDRVQRVKEHFTQQKNKIPFHDWQWASERVLSLFDFSPRWCAAFYSSKGIALWQGAATWIDPFHVTSIQLNPSRFLKKLIHREELLAHEAAHAARAAFDEPHFEELFAYLTSEKRWRHVLGPLFRTAREASSLLAIALLGTLSQTAELLWDTPSFSLVCCTLVCVLLTAWSLRLFRARLILKRAANTLLPHLRNPEHLRAVLFRLTDDEIRSLAKQHALPEKAELRWDLLKAAYLNPSR